MAINLKKQNAPSLWGLAISSILCGFFAALTFCFYMEWREGLRQGYHYVFFIIGLFAITSLAMFASIFGQVARLRPHVNTSEQLE